MKTIGLFAIDCMNYELVNRAIHISCENFNFDQITLFSDQKKDPSIPTIIIPKITSTQDYSEFVIKKLHQFVNTDFALIIQWDGYLINSNIWMDDFLNYDYIGAKWPFINGKYRVGNGGFSLRSKYLLETVSILTSDIHIQENEDVYICQSIRENLEKHHNIKFAPESVADIFSFERGDYISETFGFHGLQNIWRFISIDIAEKFIDMIDDYYWDRQEFIECFIYYFLNGKQDLFLKMYKKTKSKINKKLLFAKLEELIQDKSLVNALILSGEN